MLPTPPLNIQVRAVQIIAIVFANQFDTPINKPFDKSQCFIIPPNSLPAIVPKQLYDKFLERNCRNSKPCDIFQNGQFFLAQAPFHAVVWMCVFVSSMLANLLAWLNQANWVGTKQPMQASALPCSNAAYILSENIARCRPEHASHDWFDFDNRNIFEAIPHSDWGRAWKNICKNVNNQIE